MEYFFDPSKIPLIPPPTSEQLKRMCELGRQMADEFDKRTEGMFGLRPEDYFIVHQ